MLIDTHAHLERDSLKEGFTLNDIVDRAALNGVGKIVNASARINDWNYYSNAVRQFPNRLYWCVGLHPTEIDDKSIPALDGLCSYFADGEFAPKAIGEIGLDFYKMEGTKSEIAEKVALQKKVFARQLEFAKDMDCPVCIHARSAVLDALEILKKSGVDMSKVVFHCFSGTPDELKELMQTGARASFTGIITYKNAQQMRDCMLCQGLEKLMFETDCPYLSPVPVRGTVNEPANIKHIAEYAAKLFGISLEDISKITTLNAENFFGLR